MSGCSIFYYVLLKRIFFQKTSPYKMNGIFNENVIVKEFEFNNPLIQKIDSLIDYSIRDCHKKFFHNSEHICVYDINFTIITKNETGKVTISDKIKGLYDLNKKLTVARGNDFKFNHIYKLTIKIYSHLSHINIQYHLKLRIPIMHRHFFRKLSQNPEYIQTHCNNRNTPFHFACRKWYLYNIPQCWYSTITSILILIQTGIYSITNFEKITIELHFSRHFQRYLIRHNYQKSFHWHMSSLIFWW